MKLKMRIFCSPADRTGHGSKSRWRGMAMAARGRKSEIVEDGTSR